MCRSHFRQNERVQNELMDQLQADRQQVLYGYDNTSGDQEYGRVYTIVDWLKNEIKLQLCK